MSSKSYGVVRVTTREQTLVDCLTNPSRAGCELLERSGFYDDARKLGRRLVLGTRIFMYFSDKWGRTLVVRMRLVAK